jgi:hypothetical protein
MEFFFKGVLCLVVIGVAAFAFARRAGLTIVFLFGRGKRRR